MALTSSNTYIEPTPGTALNTARSYYNDSLRSILTNFISTSRPSAVNLTADGAPLGEVDGMLFRSKATNALYISDSVNKKTSPVGGNFTRVGIGHRIEASNVTLEANKATYEIGELVATLGDARLYLRHSNTDSISSFTDIGSPQGYTVGALSNVAFSGQSVSGIRFLATSNVGINTTSPGARLDVLGDASISTSLSLGTYLIHKNDTPTYVGFPSTNTFAAFTSNTERLRVDPEGNVSVGFTGYNSAKLLVNGNTHVNSSISVSSNVLAAGILTPNSTAQYNLYINNNQITTPGFNGVADLGVNFTGFQGGTSQFRNFIVYNGKSTAIGTFTGSTGDFTATGNITAYSDERLKSDISTISNALNKVNAMRGVNFIKDNRKSLGVIAQELEKVVPEAVIDGEFKSVAYGNLVGILIEAIKELSSKIDKLENNK